jgi:glucose-1-phosphate thymidylyltransferase
MARKGIVLSGGSGTRLYPASQIVSKQLLPVFDKPMIYYSLSVLMLADIREILLITTERDVEQYKTLLGNGSKWGISIEYAIQSEPNGLAEALIIGESFLNGRDSILILGDNIFYGNNFESLLKNADSKKNGASIFAYRVKDASSFGVVDFDKNFIAKSIEEKPKNPKSNYAVTGLYFYDSEAPTLAKSLKPSNRGELEITDLNNLYLENNMLFTQIFGRGYAWLDTGTHENLLEASLFISTIEKRQGLKILCPEEIAHRKNWISDIELEKIAHAYSNNDYGQYLYQLLKNK